MLQSTLARRASSLVIVLVGVIAIAAMPGGAFAQPGTPVATPVTSQFAATPEAAPADDALVETLMAVTLPAETIPDGEVIIAFFRISYAPGVVASYPSVAPSRSVGAEIVISGTLTATSDAPLRLIKPGGSMTDLPPGTDVAVEPGEIVIYLDNSAKQTARNLEDAPVESLAMGIFSTAQLALDQDLPPAGLRSEALGTITLSDPAQAGLIGALDVSIRRWTLAPGTALPPSDLTTPTLGFIERGAAELVITRPDGSQAPGKMVVAPHQGIPWTTLPEGTTRAIRVDGDEPLVFLELTLASAS